MTPHLYHFGNFVSHSGLKLEFKIDCDSLVAADWEALAAALRLLVPPFRAVYGIPMGGLPLAEAMRPYVALDSYKTLIVDDVCTTGNSFREFAKSIARRTSDPDVICAAVYQRNSDIGWVTSLFTLDSHLTPHNQLKT